jgi:hypothetical protein
MGIDLLVICHSVHGPEEILDRGVLQYEFLDTGSDQRKNLLFVIDRARSD